MMGTLRSKVAYKCLNDCTPAGCKGHEVEVVLNTVSDGVLVYVDNELKFGGDTNKIEAIIQALWEASEMRNGYLVFPQDKSKEGTHE